MVERSDRKWSIGEGNGKPLQYSCLENPMNSMKRQPSEWEKIIANETTDKGLISKIYKQFIQLNARRTIQSRSGKRPKQTFLQRRHTVG